MAGFMGNQTPPMLTDAEIMRAIQDGIPVPQSNEGRRPENTIFKFSPAASAPPPPPKTADKSVDSIPFSIFGAPPSTLPKTSRPTITTTADNANGSSQPRGYGYAFEKKSPASINLAKPDKRPISDVDSGSASTSTGLSDSDESLTMLPSTIFKPSFPTMPPTANNGGLFDDDMPGWVRRCATPPSDCDADELQDDNDRGNCRGNTYRPAFEIEDEEMESGQLFVPVMSQAMQDFDGNNIKKPLMRPFPKQHTVFLHQDVKRTASSSPTASLSSRIPSGSSGMLSNGKYLITDLGKEKDTDLDTPVTASSSIFSPSSVCSFGDDSDDTITPAARSPAEGLPAKLTENSKNGLPAIAIGNPYFYQYNAAAPAVPKIRPKSPVPVARERESGGFVIVGNIPYASSEIKAMVETLRQAQVNCEFPNCAPECYNDASTVVNDFHLLDELRRARGNPADPKIPEKYTNLRIKAEATIGRRNAETDEAEARTEAARRVQAYMRVNELEVEYYKDATSPNETGKEFNDFKDFKEITKSLEGVAETLVDVVESGMAEAAAPIRLNVGRMEKEVAHIRGVSQAMTQGISSMTEGVQYMAKGIRSIEAEVGSMRETGQTLTKGIQSMDTGVGRIEKCGRSFTQGINSMQTEVGHIEKLGQTFTQDIHSMQTGVGRIEEIGRTFTLGVSSMQTGVEHIKEVGQKFTQEVGQIKEVRQAMAQDIHSMQAEVGQAFTQGISSLQTEVGHMREVGRTFLQGVQSMGTEVGHLKQLGHSLKIDIQRAETFGRTMSQEVDTMRTEVGHIKEFGHTLGTGVQQVEYLGQTLGTDVQRVECLGQTLGTGVPQVECLGQTLAQGVHNMEAEVSHIKKFGQTLATDVQRVEILGQTLGTGIERVEGLGQVIGAEVGRIQGLGQTMSQGVKSLTDGAGFIEEAGQSMQQGIRSFKHGAQLMGTETKHIKEVSQTLSQGVQSINHAVNSMHQGMSSINQQISTLSSLVHQFNNSGQALNSQAALFDSHFKVTSSNMDLQVRQLERHFETIRHALDEQVRQMQTHFETVSRTIDRQIQSVTSQFSGMASPGTESLGEVSPSRKLNQQMQALNNLISLQASSQAALNDSLARSKHMMDALAESATSRPPSDASLQIHVDAAVERAIQIKLAANPQPSMQHPSSSAMGLSWGYGPPNNIMPAGPETRPDGTKRRKFKHVFGRVFGRKRVRIE